MSEKQNLRLTPQMHLRRPQDFQRAYDNGVRAGDDHLLIFVCRNAVSVSRVGLSVSKKHGSAVHRNLKRRRLRESFRLLQHELPPGIDVVLVPRQRDDSSLTDYLHSMKSLVARVSKRIFRDESESVPPAVK